MATPTTDEMYGPATERKSTDMTRYAQSEVQIPLLKTLSLPETLERFELAIGRRPGELLINIYNAANALPQIYQCVPETVINAALDAAVLKLSLAKSLGLGCILPFKKNWQVNGVWQSEYRATFVVMVRGLKELGMRTNRYRKLNEFFLYEGEEPVWDRKSGDFDTKGEQKSDRISYFGAYLRLTNGYDHTICWPASKVLAHGKQYSPTYDKKKEMFDPKSRWVTHFEEQGAKTVMKNLITHHGVISEIDQSNLERIERKSESQIIDGELSEPEEAPRIEAPIVINSGPETEPEEPGKWPVGDLPKTTPQPAATETPESIPARIQWTKEQLTALVSERFAKNDFNARAMLDMSILTDDATEAEIMRWGKIYRDHRDAKLQPGEIRTAQDSATFANVEYGLPY